MPSDEGKHDVPTSDPIKYMDIKEFRSKGYLQEVNRKFLHPHGLALEVLLDADGNERLGGVWDYRDDPEGMNFGDVTEDMAEKAMELDTVWIERSYYREEALGYLIQPLVPVLPQVDPPQVD